MFFKSNLKIWFIALGVFLTTAHHAMSQNSEPELLTVSFEQEFVLGANTGQDASYFLTYPYRVRTDSKANIYVGDSGEANIKIFSPDGTYLRSVGRQGKGPGEFAGGPAFMINSRDEIVALDPINRRITRLSAEDEILFEYVPPEHVMIWGEKVVQTANQHYIILKKPRDIGEEDPDSYRTRVLHQYDASFKDRLSSFGNFSELVPRAESKFVKMISNSLNSGYFKLVNGTIWYAPGIYGGLIYQFKKQGDRWVQSGIVRGQMTLAEAVEFGAEADESIRITTYGPKGRQQTGGKINSYSLGLLQMSDGRVLHFSGQRASESDSLHTRIEVFSPAGQLIGTTSFDAITIPANLGYFVAHNPSLWMDKTDRFYFIDREQAVVRVGRLEGL